MSGFIGELLGTMILIVLGDGVVAGVLLNRSKAQNSGWIVVTAGWAFAVMAGAFTSLAFGGIGAVNPVGPFTDMVTRSRPAGDCLLMIAGQFCGAFIGAVIVWLHYMPHWRETTDASAKLGVFCTSPAIRSPIWNFMSEVIGTFVLVFVAGAIAKVEPVKGLDPLLVGLLVWGIGVGLGGTTGYAINPARDFSPRLAHALLPIHSKGGSDWGYAWIPFVGPLVGGLAAALFHMKPAMVG